jgi:hypothetical protein
VAYKILIYTIFRGMYYTVLFINNYEYRLIIMSGCFLINKDRCGCK